MAAPRHHFFVFGERTMAVSRYRQEIEVFLPDAAVAVKHAIFFGKDGQFRLQPCPPDSVRSQRADGYARMK